MSGAGAPAVHTDGTGLRVAVVASSWHEPIMNGLIDGTRRGLADAQVAAADTTLVRVPGSFELGVVAAELVRHHDAVVALGVVIRGGTPHFEYVCAAATEALSALARTSGVPIGFGLLTCDDEDQGLDRAGLADSREDKGHEAASAAVATAVVLRDLRAAQG